jgi:multiple sugar transport system substrate-binding protein
MRVRAILLAVMLILAPLTTQAADLVVWWEEGYNPAEDQAVKEIIAAFEQKTSKQVELVQHSQNDMVAKTLAAIAAGQPPDFLFGTTTDYYYGQWAYEGRLVDLTDVLGSLAGQFDQDALARATKLDGTTGRRGLYSLPMGRLTEHVHAWKNLLEQAGFTLANIPKQWEPFWSFWCDTVQPAVRKATGRDDIYGVGLTMSVVGSIDTDAAFAQFVSAYQADYVTRGGRLVIDEPEVRARLVKALAAYTTIWRKGCTPPASVDWDGTGNNKAFLAQTVVVTLNNTLSIPNALRTTRPEDYAKNMVTLGWPEDIHGQPLAIYTGYAEAAAFRDGGHAEVAEDFVRFLVGEGWLAHWLDFAGDRWMPPMRGLLETPFWLDPSDPHRMAAAMQLLARPSGPWDLYPAISGNWRHGRVWAEHVWPKTIHRVVTEGITPEQAVDEAIARVKQILSE